MIRSFERRLRTLEDHAYSHLDLRNMTREDVQAEIRRIMEANAGRKVSDEEYHSFLENIKESLSNGKKY